MGTPWKEGIVGLEVDKGMSAHGITLHVLKGYNKWAIRWTCEQGCELTGMEMNTWSKMSTNRHVV